MWTIHDGWVYFDDGTRVRAISGAQDVNTLDFQALGGEPSDLVEAFNVDFVLTVGGDPSMDIGGVPFGDPADDAGYVGLSDALRSGDTGGEYIGNVATNSSLSDILRGNEPSPGFDVNQYNPNAPGTPSDWSITDVIDSVTKGIGALAGAAVSVFNATKSASGGQRAPSGATGQTLAQRLFGANPGASGNLPQVVLWGSLLAVGTFLMFAMIRRA